MLNEDLAEGRVRTRDEYLSLFPGCETDIDEQLSAADSYQYMVPVFGEGIQYGAPLAIERQQVKFLSNALRPEKMKGYARMIAKEVEDWIADWGDRGEKDFYEEFKELVLRTSTHCLMGSEFRAKLTDEFGALYQDLDRKSTRLNSSHSSVSRMPSSA